MLSSQPEEIKSYRCVLVGDESVGKTAFVTLHRTGICLESYYTTIGVALYPLCFTTSKGTYKFDVWDTAGSEEFRGSKESRYRGVQCALIMFDVTRPQTYTSVLNWYDEIIRMCGHIPMVLVGNKTDVEDEKRMVKPESIDLPRQLGLHYYEVSNKSNLHIIQPFLQLIKELDVK